MKYWVSEHIFDHPWNTVVNAAFRKYPNPENKSVIGIDVLDQSVQEGVLKTERILQSRFPIPSWAARLTGFSGKQYSHEYTEIDPTKKEMLLVTRNLNLGSLLRVDEKLVYTPHKNSDRTVLRQELSVSVNLPAFTDNCEKAFLSTYEANAMKGRKGMEWVIREVKQELDDISLKISHQPNCLSC